MTVREPGIGALATLTDATRLAALATVRQGRVYDLAVELNRDSPAVPGFAPFQMGYTQTPEMTAPAGFSFASEVINGAIHAGTHIDALIHVQADGRIHGGAPVEEVFGERGFSQYGIETVPPIVGRALILDAAALKGVEYLADGEEITLDDVAEMLKRSGTDPRSGDIVLVRTGKIRQWSDPAAFGAKGPGLSREAALFLHERGMVVLGTDTAATEPSPFADPAQTLHRAMLVDAGVHLIENLWLEDVCSDGITEALFIALPLKLTGASGSWLRPIAIV